jgi:hypothetical protein
MLFLGACDVWPRELPPGWELEWVDDDEWLHHEQASYDIDLVFAVFNKLWTIYFKVKNHGL